MGIYRAISAANLRQKNLFLGLGIYEGTAAHLTFTAGIIVPAIFLAYQDFAYRFLVPSSALSVEMTSPLLSIVFVTVLAAVAAILLHLDFRQYLMLGITAGVFGATVLRDRFDMKTGAFMVFMGVGGSGIALIILVAGSLSFSLKPEFLPEPFFTTALISATLLGYGLGIAAKETIIHHLWEILIQHEGIHLA